MNVYYERALIIFLVFSVTSIKHIQYIDLKSLNITFFIVLRLAKLVPESYNLWKALIFLFSFGGKFWIHHTLSEAAYVRPQKKYKNAELHTMLNEDDTLIQKQMAEMLNVAK